MGKKQSDDKANPRDHVELQHPFIGGEDDDLEDMVYIANDEAPIVNTHPPETKEEADLLEADLAEKAKGEAEEEEAEAEVVAKEETAAEAPAQVEEEDLPKVPKDRFDEVNQRMKKAEDKVKSLEKQLETVVETKKTEPEPDPFNYAAKEKEAVEAVLEGDTEKYASIQAEIRQALREETLRDAKKLSQDSTSQLKEDMTFEETGAAIESQFPQFVEGGEKYNEAARDEMLELYVGYLQSGRYSRAEALNKAATSTVRIYGFQPADAPQTTDNVVDIKQKQTDVKAKAAAANSQPPRMEPTTRKDGDEAPRDVRNMSDEEFQALPESAKRRMRGDVL